MKSRYRQQMNCSCQAHGIYDFVIHVISIAEKNSLKQRRAFPKRFSPMVEKLFTQSAQAFSNRKSLISLGRPSGLNISGEFIISRKRINAFIRSAGVAHSFWLKQSADTVHTLPDANLLFRFAVHQRYQYAMCLYILLTTYDIL